MAYVWVEDESVTEDSDVRDVVERTDYDEVVTERDGLITQRDALLERAETAERGWEEAKNKYADAFITSPARMKRDQESDVQRDGRPSTYEQLFGERGDYGAY